MQGWVIIFMEVCLLIDSSVSRWFINVAFTALLLFGGKKLFKQTLSLFLSDESK